MSINWNEMQQEMHPIKDYDDLRRRWREAYAYPFVCETYNLTMLEMAEYTRFLLGEDTRNRYLEYAQSLIETFKQLQREGVGDIQDFVRQVDTREAFEAFSEQTTVAPKELIASLKYLVYWFIPAKKLLSGLVSNNSPLKDAIQLLRSRGIRTNLDILQQGITLAARNGLAKSSAVPEEAINELVNRADFSRMPWAAQATISNIIGAGYGSLKELANANPDQLCRDFHRYGISIGKNLKLGNEIDNSYRIARIMPLVLE
jgi:hypothetical protein